MLFKRRSKIKTFLVLTVVWAAMSFIYLWWNYRFYEFSDNRENVPVPSRERGFRDAAEGDYSEDLSSR
jgi:hypothetical protein